MILLITDVFYYCKCIYILDTFFMLYFCYFFFFKQKTEYDMRISDWSSYVCSSDLVVLEVLAHGDIEGLSSQCGGGRMAILDAEDSGSASPRMTDPVEDVIEERRAVPCVPPAPTPGGRSGQLVSDAQVRRGPGRAIRPGPQYFARSSAAPSARSAHPPARGHPPDSHIRPRQ